MLAALLALVMLVGALSATAAAKGAAAYQDVSADDWFYGAVGFVTENGLMTGTNTGFEPQRTTSRAMLWTILSRLDGRSAKRNAADWYAAAQLWAVQNDISDGTAPDAPITREQLASMLYRYAQRRGLVRAASSADLGVFADAAAVSAYAEEAVQWAVEAGLLNGMGGKLCPQGAATRAQVAEILRRMCEKWSLLTQDSAAAVAAAAWLYDDPEHTHSWTYTANKDGTHTAACACGETKAEYCTLVTKDRKSWKCSTCGFVVEGEANAGVSTWRELETAVENGKSPIYLAADIAIGEAIQIKKDTIFYGCGHTLTRADGYTGGMFTEGPHYSDLTLADLRLDGRNAESDLTEVAVIENAPGGKLTIKNCVIENFNAQQLIYSRWAARCEDHNNHEDDPTADRVNIFDTTIRNNVLTTTATKNNNYDNKRAGTMFWMARSDLNLKNVTITDNTITSATNGTWIRGGGNLFFMKDRSALTADELFVSDNKTLCLLNSFYSDNCHHTFNSGYIKDCTGQIDIYGDVTVGEDMTIELPEGTTFWFTNSSGVRTLTNNGTILATVAHHDWSETQPIYKGTGTVKELIDFEIQ